MSSKRIASAFRFSEADLNANREGKLSDAQRSALRKRYNVSLVASVAVLAGIVVIAFTRLSPIDLMYLVEFLALAALLYIRKMARLKRDLSAECIAVYFGRIHLRVQNKKRSDLYIEADTGLRRFRVTTSQMLALRDGDYYMLYAAPGSGRPLSIEPVDMARADDTDRNAVDLGASAEDEAAVEKPKRDLFVLGDDGELQVKRGR